MNKLNFAMVYTRIFGHVANRRKTRSKKPPLQRSIFGLNLFGLIALALD
jgi:hypothetical protein